MSHSFLKIPRCEILDVMLWPDLPQLSSLKYYPPALGPSFSEMLQLDCFWLEKFSKYLKKINLCSYLQD